MSFIPLSPSEWAVLTGVVLIAAFAKGVTGFGFALLSVPFLLLVVPAKELVVLSLMMVTWIGFLITLSSWRHVNWRRSLSLSLASFLGIPLGTYILYRIDPSILRVLIAAVVILFSLLLLVGYSRRIKREGQASLFFGFLSGILGSSTSLSGPPVVLFLVSQGWQKQDMRATLASFLFISSLAALVSQAAVGVLTTRVVFTGLVIAPIAFCGFYFGQGVVRRIGVGLFRRIAIILVMASGVSAIVMELF